MAHRPETAQTLKLKGEYNNGRISALENSGVSEFHPEPWCRGYEKEFDPFGRDPVHPQPTGRLREAPNDVARMSGTVGYPVKTPHGEEEKSEKAGHIQLHTPKIQLGM